MMEEKVIKNRVQRVCAANLKAVYYAIMRITGRYRKFEGDLYNYEACYERNFTTRELAKEIEKETSGLSYYQIRTCIKQLRLQEYIKFPEKGVCRILKSIEEKEGESVKESFYLPDYFLQAVKQKGIDWKPCDTLLLHYVLKRTDFYNHCREKAFDSIKKWNDFEDREDEIMQYMNKDFEKYLDKGGDPEEYDDNKVYEVEKERLRRNALHALNWQGCVVSFHEGRRKISKNTGLSDRIIRNFIKKIKMLFGEMAYQFPNKPIRMLRYTYKCKSFTISLPPKSRWKDIFAKEYQKILNSIVGKAFYYVTRTFIKTKKGYDNASSQEMKDKVALKEGIFIDGEIIDREKEEIKRVSYPYMEKEYKYLSEDDNECYSNEYITYRCYEAPEYEGYNANEFEAYRIWKR